VLAKGGGIGGGGNVGDASYDMTERDLTAVVGCAEVEGWANEKTAN
jgi:hypothetical protein